MNNHELQSENPVLDANSIKLLADKSTNGFLVLKDNTIIYVNQAIAELFETNKEALLGKKVTDITTSILSNSAPEALKRYYKLIEGESSRDNEQFQFVDSTGRVRNISVSADVTNVSGENLISIIIQDHTERVAIEEAEQKANEAERRAQESMKSIQNILDQAEDFLFICDEQGRILTFNDYFQKRLGFESEELEEMSIFQLHPSRIREEARETYLEAFDEKTDQCNCPFITKDGQEIPVIINVFNGRWKGKNVVYGIARDISNILEANEALTSSERLLSSVFSSITDGISILDEEMNIIRVNSTMQDWYAHSMPLVGKKCYEAYHLRETPCEICPTIDALEEGTPSMEYVAKIGPDGNRIGTIELHSFPLFDRGSNELNGVIEYVRDISDQRLAEDMLRESESRFRSLFEDSPISLWEEDFSKVKRYFDDLRAEGITDFREYFAENPEEVRECIRLVEVIRVNKATLQLHKTATEDELITGLESIISEGAIDTFREEILALADGATHFRGESVFEMVSGEYRDLLLDVTIPPGHEDTWSRVYVAMLDITERKRAKMMLDREREAYRLVADAAVHAESTHDLCARVLSSLITTLGFDLGTIRLLVPEENKLQLIAAEGITRDEVKKNVDLDSTDGTNMLVARTAQTKKPILADDVDVSDEVQIQIDRINELGIESLIFWPILGAEHDVIGVLNIAAREKREFVDFDRRFFDTISDLLATVLERQKTEEQLRTTEEHFRIVAESVRDGLTIRRNDRVVLINDRACEIFGYPREDLKDMTILELASPEERERLKKAYAEMRSLDSELAELEFWVQKKDGSRAFVKNRYTIVMNDDGSASHFIITTDATERKLAEEELIAARARAEFFNDLMAHDLNNVHQGIMTSLELLLLNPDLPPHLKNTLQAALDQVKRSLELIANVRKFSAVDATPSDLTATHISDAVDSAHESIKHSFPNRNITLQTGFDEACCARADEFLVDVFYNLFHNAVKFADSEDIIIEVEANRLPSEGMIEITVADHGPGIADEHKENLFSRLLPDRRSGSGIGLTLVMRIITRYGGNVSVEDRIKGKPSSGSKFILQIPECVM